jgi:hypothetical protein
MMPMSVPSLELVLIVSSRTQKNVVAVQISDVLTAVPAKRSYWLRTGILDHGSRKVGTMEIPLSSVVPLQQAAK